MRILFTVKLFILALIASAFAVDKRPNILLILSDDHSYPHLGAYGDSNCTKLEITPNLDALARAGMLFDRAYTAAPQCAPSRIAIFAGRSPVGLSVTRFAHPADSEVPLFTDVLKENGYWVGMDGRLQHLDGRNRDLDYVSKTLVELGRRGPKFESRFDHFTRGLRTKGETLLQVGNTVGKILDTVPKEKPWFLYFGLSQPHRPWGEDHDGIDPDALTLPPDWPDLPGVRLDYARYLADVRDLDTGVGLILKLLKARGLDENTIVIFMGDNGEALLRAKGTLTTRGINVPLIVRWPGTTKPGSVSNSLISGVDLAPTILKAAGLEASEGMTGTSFLSELEGKRFEGRDHVYAERGWHPGPINQSNGFDLSRSVTNYRYHFIYNAIPERKYGPVDMTRGNVAWDEVKAALSKGELSELHERLYFHLPRPIFELYDLERDPYQLVNLAGSASTAAIEEELRSHLDRWMLREDDYLPLPSHTKIQMDRDKGNE